MIRTLKPFGDDVALVFDKVLLDALGMTPEQVVQITLQDGSLTITPAPAEVSSEEISEAIAKLRPRYQKMLETLAN